MTATAIEPIVEKRESSLLAMVNVLLAGRRLILMLVLAGGVIGFLTGFLSKRTYTSSATFIPQGSENGASAFDLAAAASQFGLRIPGTSGAWNPAVYVDLVRSEDLLAPIVSETFDVPEEHRKATLIDLFKIQGATQQEKVARAVIQTQNHIRSREARALGAVELAVTTPWPSVSYQVANSVVNAVHRFNLEARSAQAAAERNFIEPIVRQSEQSLHEAENRLADFTNRNRIITGAAPERLLERERLQRDVATRQQLYTSILQKYEEARIGERRNTPVITVVGAPRVPVLPNPRNSILKGAIGALAGGLFGFLLTFLSHGMRAARKRESDDAREFFQLIGEVTPQFLRRRFNVMAN
jgi:uncharacterized protein involved in exopolysaccharide biosynthesis